MAATLGWRPPAEICIVTRVTPSEWTTMASPLPAMFTVHRPGAAAAMLMEREALV